MATSCHGPETRAESVKHELSRDVFGIHCRVIRLGLIRVLFSLQEFHRLRHIDQSLTITPTLNCRMSAAVNGRPIDWT